MLYKAFLQFVEFTDCRELTVLRWCKIILRTALVIFGFWVVYPILISKALVSNISRIPNNVFSSDIKPYIRPPDILLCSPKESPLEYKVLFNESRVNELQLSPEQLDLLSSAAMNGPTAESSNLALSLGFTSFQTLWDEVTVKKEKVIKAPKLSSACGTVCVRAEDSPQCVDCTKRIPLYWLWIKPLKTRCLKLNSTHFPNGYVALKSDGDGVFESGGKEGKGRLGMWIGNLKFETVTDLYHPDWIAVSGIIFVEGKLRREICQSELGREFGVPFHDCDNDLEELDQYTLWNIIKGPIYPNSVDYLDFDRGVQDFTFGLWRIDDILRINYTREFPKIIKLEFGISAADSFSGMHCVFILMFVLQTLTDVESRKRVQRFILKSITGLLIIILIGIFLWLMSHALTEYFENLYTTSFSISSQSNGQKLPRLKICSDHYSNRWFNRTKLKEYGVTNRLFQYLNIVGFMSYPYSYSRPDRATFQLVGGPEQPYRDLFAFQNLSDVEGTGAEIHSEFEELSAKLGISLDSPPYLVTQRFLMDPAQWILDCHVNGKEVERCHEYFQVTKEKRHGDTCWEFNETLIQGDPTAEATHGHHSHSHSSEDHDDEKGMEIEFDLNVLTGEDSDYGSPYLGTDEKFRGATAKYSIPADVQFESLSKILHSLEDAKDFSSNILISINDLTRKTFVRNCAAEPVCPEFHHFPNLDIHYYRFVQKECGCSFCQSFVTGSVQQFRSDCCSANQIFLCLLQPKYYADMGNCNTQKLEANVLVEMVHVQQRCIDAYFFDPLYPYSGVVQKEDIQCPRTCESTSYRPPIVKITRDSEHESPSSAGTSTLLESTSLSSLSSHPVSSTSTTYDITNPWGSSTENQTNPSSVSVTTAGLDSSAHSVSDPNHDNSDLTGTEDHSHSPEHRDITTVRLQIAPNVFVEEYAETYSFRIYEFLAILFSLSGSLFGLSILGLMEYAVAGIALLKKKMKEGKQAPEKEGQIKQAWRRKQSVFERDPVPSEEISKVVDAVFTIYLVVAFIIFLFISNSLIKEIRNQPFSIENDFLAETYHPPGLGLCAEERRGNMTDAVLSGTCEGKPCSHYFAIRFEADGMLCWFTNQWQTKVKATLFRLLNVQIDREKALGISGKWYVWLGDPVDWSPGAVKRNGYEWEVGSELDLVVEYTVVKQVVEPKFLLECQSDEELTVPVPLCADETTPSQFCSTQPQITHIRRGGHRNNKDPCQETHFKIAGKEVRIGEDRGLLQIQVLSTHSMVKTIIRSERLDFLNILSFCLGYIGILTGLSAYDLILMIAVIPFMIFKKMSRRPALQAVDRRRSYVPEEREPTPKDYQT